MEKLCDLFFELSNETRLGILETLQVKPLKLTGLSNALDATPQEISRNLHRLTETGLVTRTLDGDFTLTPIGCHAISSLDGLRFVTDNMDYFKAHTLECIPSALRLRVGQLHGAEPLTDVMKVFHGTENLIREAEERVWIMTDQVLMSVLPTLHEAVERKVEFKLLVPMDIKPPKAFTDHLKHEEWMSGDFERCS